jgi:hypothetical protein
VEAAVRRTVQGLGSISSALLKALDAPLSDLLERHKDTASAGSVGTTIGKLVAEAAEHHQTFLAPPSA